MIYRKDLDRVLTSDEVDSNFEDLLNIVNNPVVAVYMVGSSATDTHKHKLYLRKLDFDILLSGGSVEIESDLGSEPESEGHTHVVDFSYNANTYTLVVGDITSNSTDLHVCNLVHFQ